MHSLKVAGGVILFLFGVQSSSGKWMKARSSPEEGRDLRCSAGGAFHRRAGPMMAVIVLTDNDVYTVPQRLETGVVLVVVLFITYLLLLFSMRFAGDRSAGRVRPGASNGTHPLLAGSGNRVDCPRCRPLGDDDAH